MPRIDHHWITNVWTTVEPVLKDHPIVRKNMVFQDKWSLVTGWSICTEMQGLLPRICDPSRQVVSHGSGLSRKVSLYMYYTWTWALQNYFIFHLCIHALAMTGGNYFLTVGRSVCITLWHYTSCTDISAIYFKAVLCFTCSSKECGDVTAAYVWRTNWA